MKKLNYGILDWIILLAFICMCGIDVFFNFIVSILKVITLSNVLGNPFDFVKFITEGTVVLFGIPWLSKLLLLLASIIPSLFLSLLLRSFRVPAWINYTLSILLYWGVVLLFSSYIFWIVIGVVILCFFICFLVKVIRRKGKSEKKV